MAEMHRIVAFLLLIGSVCSAVGHNPCNSREYGKDYVVCVCNATYCDDILPATFTAKNQVFTYTSSKAGKRLERAEIQWSKTKKSMPHAGHTVLVNLDDRRQTIYGFGGAFTDAAGYNIASLSNATQRCLMESYFGQNGIKYNLGRVPMASCDFSWRVYSYDDSPNDFQLNFFALTDEDIQFKIPYIKWAGKLCSRPLKLVASPWSAPAWMKTSASMSGNGTLIGSPGSKYYKTWADYFIRFLSEYDKNGVSFWGVTAQNEPSTGFIYNYSFQTMGFSAETQRDFIKLDLGPALNSSRYRDVKLMVLDDQRLLLPKWAKTVLSDAAVKNFTSFVAVHWYTDMFTPAELLDATHALFPDVPIIGTEASQGFARWEKRGPVLGSWQRAEKYAHFIISDLNHWVSGWIEWNLILDIQGGPNWARNFLDSPMIKTGADEFVKQPMFYAIGHFSKFISPGAVKIGLKVMPPSSLLEGTAFLREDDVIVVVLHNRGLTSSNVLIKHPTMQLSLNVTLPWMSITTFLWQR